MRHSLLLHALLPGIAARAAPAPQLDPLMGPRSSPPPTSDEFSLAMTVNSTYVSLTATYNGTADLVLRADRLSAYPGTPVYANTTDSETSYTTALVLDLTNSSAATAGMTLGTYGISVPSVGNLYGLASNVFAVDGYQEFEFDIVDGQVYHKLTSASQSWFACLDSVDGAENYFLKWGVFQRSGAAPAGCVVTNVVQNFNVQGGSTS